MMHLVYTSGMADQEGDAATSPSEAAKSAAEKALESLGKEALESYYWSLHQYITLMFSQVISENHYYTSSNYLVVKLTRREFSTAPAARRCVLHHVLFSHKLFMGTIHPLHKTVITIYISHSKRRKFASLECYSNYFGYLSIT